MATSRRPANTPPVVFDDAAWGEDLTCATAAGGEVAEAARRAYEQDGVPLAQLRACDPEGRDGTRLQNCVKVYLPQPHGRYGLVFAVERDARGKLRLAFAGFGLRHPARGSRQPSVYRIADRRLNP